MANHRKREDGPFAMLPDEVLKSDACRTLPHPAHRILVAIAAQYYGTNNGSLSLTRKTAAEYGIGNPYALGDGLRELEERGLIAKTRPGRRIPPRSSLFALSWRLINAPNKLDPHDARETMRPADGWRTWKAAKRSQHWITERSQRKPRDTRPSSAGIHGESKMSSAGIHERPPLPVAQGYCSDISGVGALSDVGSSE